MIGVSGIFFSRSRIRVARPKPADERIAALEVFPVKQREVGSEPLAEPDIVPIALGDGVAPPLVSHLVHDRRVSGRDAFLAVEDDRGVLGAPAEARGLDVRQLLA
jgi:hypothetical protein